MSNLNKGIAKAEVDLKWDPNTGGGPVHDLDIIAAVYRAEDPYGSPPTWCTSTAAHRTARSR